MSDSVSFGLQVPQGARAALSIEAFRRGMGRAELVREIIATEERSRPTGERIPAPEAMMVTVPRSVAEELHREAARRGEKRGALIRGLIAAHLARMGYNL